MRENQKQRRGAGDAGNRNSRCRHQLDVKVSSRKASSLRWRMKLQKLLKLVAVVAFVFTLVVGVYRGIDYFLFENPRFQVNEISYSTDGNLGRERVLDCLGLRAGENILRLDLEAMREKILTELEEFLQPVRINLLRRQIK